ncbi:WecB/TagA/CpsF family glycosyltransferase [Archangium lipolyticum]|uniref:WecB/TagA/CpsF family glycosyltransferase n=1 Tax=Archangium lipolyticum TaxID=2970465 RepID=UPI0027D44BE3|nr:WecB/TagA/CpsF family glycosyltransferase [Archangium lipolyticum]
MNGVVGLETPRSGLASLVPRRAEWEQGRAFSRVRIGHVPLDLGRPGEVLQSIEALVTRGQGGRILTPDVEQVVLAEANVALRQALATADLSLAGSPVVARAARVIGPRVPESLTGAQWLTPLVKLARERSWRVLVVAERPGVAEWTACALRDRYGLLAVGVAAPGVPEDGRGAWVERLIDRIALTRPHLVLVSMATPKQELFCQYAAARLQPAVLVGIGAALESSWDEGRPVQRWRELAGSGWLDRCRRWLTAPVRLLLRNLSFLRILAGSRR